MLLSPPGVPGANHVHRGAVVFGEAETALVEFETAEPWVEIAAFQRPAAVPDGSIDGGRRFWLSDAQINLCGGERAWFSRVVTEVVSPDGLQPTAQISLDFEPTFERLIIHHIRVLRGAEVRELDVRSLLSVLRRERDLERAMYDGRVTAHLVVPDVRVGDIIDYAYTIKGDQPIFEGRFATEVGFQWSCWVGETRVRLLADAQRSMVTRSWGDTPIEARRTLDDGAVERVWTARDQAGVRVEQDLPGWVRPMARLRIADAMAWNEVAQVFAPGYTPPERLPDELEAEAARLDAATTDPSRRVVEALRLVQRGLRYHSISLGDGGFVPRSVDYIWAHRAGDCKDSSRLLVALLRRLGVEADPALVHTGLGPSLDRDAPNLVAFNHCIVRVQVEGRAYWLDPTRYPQGGDLKTVSQARWGWALPLIDEALLEPMGEDAPTPIYDVKEVYRLGTPSSGLTDLTVETVYRGWRADDIRRQLNAEGPEILEQRYREYYERTYGAVTQTVPLEVEDDFEANILKITERYGLERAWEPIEGGRYRFTTLDDLFAQHLTTQRSGKRREAIDLGSPRAVSVETLMHLDEPLSVTGWDDVFEVDGVRATSKLEAMDGSNKNLRLVRGLNVWKRDLPAEAASAFFDLRENAFKSSSVVLTKASKIEHPKVGGVDRRLVFLGIWILIIIVVRIIAAYTS